MYKVNYSILSNSINLKLLINQLSEEETIPDPISIAFSKDGLTLFIYFEDELTLTKKQALDTLISNHNPETLEKIKQQKRKKIDERTSELIKEGFEFNGIIFSGSIEAQSRIIGAYTARTFATYPIRWMSKDDSTYLDITNEDMLTSFFLTGFSVLKTKIDLGSNLKVQVSNATSIEEVDDIIDPR